MANGRMRFRCQGRKGDDAVSEVIGDIMLVAISVSLMGIIAIQVSNFQPPKDTSRIDLVAKLDGRNLTITHMGGEDLDDYYTDVVLGMDKIAYVHYKISDSNGSLNGSKTWSIGETWRLDINWLLLEQAANPHAEMFVSVIDKKHGTVVLDQVLKQGPSTADFPDLGLEKGSLAYSNNNPDDGERIMINVTVANYGNVDVSGITVRWFDGKTEINSTAITSLRYWNASDLPNCTRAISINWTTTYIGKHVISVKVIPKLDETNLANNYISRTLFVGAGVVEGILGPNIQIDTIVMDNVTQNFDPVPVTIMMHNSGQTGAAYELEINDSYQSVRTPIKDEITTATSPFGFGVLNPSDDKTVKVEWIPTKGGPHQFQVRVVNITPAENDAEIPLAVDKDYAAVDIRVLPNVLLVDDDKAAGGSPRDTVTHMRDALTAIGVNADLYTVTAGDGPQYSQVGMEPYYLAKYDVVIWMTGYENKNTLTKVGASSDTANLQTYLNNGGALWLIGQDILSDLGTANGFVQNYLHITGFTMGGEDGGISDPIKGVVGNLVTDGKSFNTSVPLGQPSRGDYVTFDATKAKGLMMHATASVPNSVVSNRTVRGDANNYKVAFCAFDFSHIKSSSEKAIFTYIMMEWFNATAELNTDLAVSDIQFAPNQPHFKQDVNVTVWVRNNGKTDLDGVRVVFRDVINGVETLIPVDPLDFPGGGNPMTITSTLAGYGGWIRVSKHWTPDVVGYHIIRAIVDPENLIPEVNEMNNEINSILTPTEVFVESITLVVDDDGSAGSPYTNGNVTWFVTDALGSLKYSYEYTATSGASDGPDISTLTKYNSVIWVCSGNGGAVLTPNDISNLQTYLTGYRGNLWVYGQELPESNSWNDATWRNTLGVVAASTNDVGTPPQILGMTGNNITHGMSYPTDHSGFMTVADTGDLITPDGTTTAMGSFRNAAGGFNGVAFHNLSGVDYKTLVTTFEYGFVNDTTDRLEMMYLVEHWFGQVDDRIELRVTGVDIFFGRDNAAAMAFEDVKPVLGDSYILQAKIRNYGGTPAGAVVRFIDGSTVINSANVYVPASTVTMAGEVIPGTGIAEVIWTPLFAGNRPITVKVDPDMNIPQTGNPRDATGEVFKKNNNATRYTDVYFFYDNMERGIGDWTHDTTIANINGESSIEYFDTVNPVNTNIINKTDATQTSSWYQTQSDAHTKPSSYWTQEPSKLNASRPPLRIAFCIDDSGSMSWNDNAYLRLNAAYNLVNNDLSAVDWVSLYRFSGGTFPRLVNWESGTHAGTKAALGPPPAAHPSFVNSGGTPMYECMNAALTYITNAMQPGEYPALIVLTDGGANGGMSELTIKNAVMTNGVPVYTASLGTYVDVPAMYELAERSNGGKYFAAKTAADLNGMFQDIISAIIAGASSRGTYTMDFTSDDGSMLYTGDWQYGSPSVVGPATCRGGSGNCWGTILNGNYNINTYDWLFGPWYKLPAAATTLTMNTWYWNRLGTGDGASLYYRYIRGTGTWSAGVDNGAWNWIGNFNGNTGGNWVQLSSGNLINGCGGSCRNLYVQFVIYMYSDGANVQPGLYIDDWTVAFDAVNATTEEVVLEQPVGTEQWWTHQTRNITWWYYGSIANPTATLEFSDDAGTTWGTIATNVPVLKNGVRNAYNWSTPDNISDHCRVRVTVGAASNESLSNFELFGPNFNTTGPMQQNNLTTPYFSVGNYKGLKLSFWQKYDLLNNDNGGVITIGLSNNSAGPYKYIYVIPTKPYPGNLRLDKYVYDDETPANRILWAFTGRSAGNTLGWEYVEVDLTPYTNYQYMRVRLSFITWGLGTGGGWWVDDVKVTGSRANTVTITNSILDQWEYRVDPNDATNHIWWNHNPDDGDDLKSGIDNSLYTKNIDLTKAKYAYFNAKFKFNLDDQSGRPPDGFRVELSNDNGITWRPINLGVRSAWGVSGDYLHAGPVDERDPTGTKAYCGIQDGGADANAAMWVKADTLWRLNVNISGWNGEVIKLRFRVVTNLDTHHYASWGAADPWKGFAVDDVVVSGETLVSG